MTLRRRANIFFLVFLLGGAIIDWIWITFLRDKMIVVWIISFIYIVSMGVKIIKFRCPRCKKAMILNRLRYLGDYYYPTFYSPRYCSECGYDLESVEG